MLWAFVLLFCLSIPDHCASTPKPKCMKNRPTPPPLHVEPYTLDPLTACHTIDRKFGSPNEPRKVSLAGFLGRSYDPLIDKSFFPILEESFKNCLQTPDSRFNIPDNYLAELIMDREVDSDAKLSTTFKEALKDTSAGGTASGSGAGNAGTGAASGCANYQSTKKKMEKGDKAMFHLTVKNIMYRLTGDLSAPFTPHYRDRLEPIIEAIETYKLNRAKYFIQRLIADYGTHITMEATVGTMLEYRAYVASSAVTVDESMKTVVTAQATATLKEKSQSGQGGYGQSSQRTKQQSQFDMSVEAWTMGGAETRQVISTNPNDVLDDSHPVALSWKIYPIYMMMESGSLNVTLDTARQLRDLFEEATNEYLERNTFRGCMDANADNFDFQANVDDGTCAGNTCSRVPLSNDCAGLNTNSVNASNPTKRLRLFHKCVTTKKLKLTNQNGQIMQLQCENRGSSVPEPVTGGIFQTCEPHPTSKRIEEELAKLGKSRPPPCDGFHISNFVTRDMTCSTGQRNVIVAHYDHYLPEEKIFLSQRRCISPINCTVLRTTIILREKVSLTAHWCVHEDPEQLASLGFGGYFDQKQKNNFNGLYVCPQWSRQIRLSGTTSLCLSQPTKNGSMAQLTRLFSSDHPNVGCLKGHSVQLITVLGGKKIYGCILKKHAYHALNSPTVISGAYVNNHLFKSDFGRSQLIIRTETDVDRVCFDDDAVQYGIFDYLDRYMTKLVQPMLGEMLAPSPSHNAFHAFLWFLHDNSLVIMITLVIANVVLGFVYYFRRKRALQRRRIKQHNA